MSLTVNHQPDKQCFTIVTENDEAILEYSLDKNQGKIDFHKTYVPQSLRGKGVAEKLVRQGLHWARENSYEIYATCWYVKRFLK